MLTHNRKCETCEAFFYLRAVGQKLKSSEAWQCPKCQKKKPKAPKHDTYSAGQWTRGEMRRDS